MFGIGGGGFNIVSMVSQIALSAVTGGIGGIIMQALKQVALQVMDQILQNVGQQLGLPQSVIDGAQALGHAAAGDTQGASQNWQEALAGVGASPFDIGAAQQAADAGAAEGTNSANQAWTQSLGDSVDENGGRAGRGQAGGAKGGESFLYAIARAMGNALDKKMNEMKTKADNLGNLDSQSSQYGSESAKLQALGQEVSILSNALNQAIKSIGESATTLARKQ